MQDDSCPVMLPSFLKSAMLRLAVRTPLAPRPCVVFVGTNTGQRWLAVERKEI